MNFPPWFLWVVSGCWGITVVGGLPWCSWVTYTLIAINERGNQLNVNSDRISSLERQSEAQSTQLQVIAATRFTQEQARSIDSRLDRMEVKVDDTNKAMSELRREFDRTFPKAASVSQK